MSSVQNLGYLLYIWDYTTQLYGGYKKLIQGSRFFQPIRMTYGSCHEGVGFFRCSYSKYHFCMRKTPAR